MAQQNYLGGVSTTVSHEGKYTVIRYHWTDIVKFNDKEIILDSNGWKTQTTKTRMNQASNQYGLGYCVFQKDYEWFVTVGKKDLGFTDRMRIKR